MSNPPSEGPAPTPVVVYLSGSRRGGSERLSGDEIRIGSGPDADLHLPPDTEPLPAAHHATLRRRGLTYEIFAEGDNDVWVNGEHVDHFTLASGDVLEIGRDGAVLRFRLYDAGVEPYKTLPQIFSDCMDCARRSERGRAGKAAMLLGGVPKEMATQTSRVFRVSVLTVLVGLGIVTALQARRSADLERRLATEATRVEGLAHLLEQTQMQVPTPEDLANLFAGLQSSVSDRLDALEELSGAEARVIRAAAQSTVFLQGGYGFVEPESGRPLRLVLGPDGQPVRNMAGEPAISLDGEGPPLEIFLTGTAFVVSEDGRLLTNRHVSNPWEFDQAGQGMLAAGFEGRMARLVGYLPGVAEPFELETLAASDDADVAVLCCAEPTDGAYLPLAEQSPEPGDGVIVVGYPLGIRALMARTNPAFIDELRSDGIQNFWEVARRLSRAGHVTPLASRGIVGQVTTQNVVYDAETTSGGSGGPVLSLNGQVVAINAAILPEFGGSNLGVPVARGREVLADTNRR